MEYLVYSKLYLGYYRVKEMEENILKKENVAENYKNIEKLAGVLTEVEKLFDNLPDSIQQEISSSYNDPKAIQSCIQRGKLAANRIRDEWHILIDGLTGEKNREVSDQGKISICFSNLLLLDRLHILAVEYSISTNLLIEIAVKHLLDDVNLIRNLRSGKIKVE